MAIAATPYHPKPPAVKGSFGPDRGLGGFVPSKGVVMSHSIGPSHAITNTTPVNTVSVPSYSPTTSAFPVSGLALLAASVIMPLRVSDERC